MKFLRFADLCAAGRVTGRRVFIRADLNVPQDEHGHITEDTRIRASLPAIQMALDAGAAVMVTSHLGRPAEGEFKAQDSLAPIAQRLGQLLGRDVPLVSDWVGGGFVVPPGSVVLLENCRLNLGEKKNDPQLAAQLGALCDIFVHDAFGTAHRAEATTYGIALTAPVACAGPLLAAEMDAIAHALERPRQPLVAIVGGSKVSTKLSILKTLAGRVDQLIVGGGIANTFLLAAGHPIGLSLAEPDMVAQAQEVMAIMQARGAAVPLPVDMVVADEVSAQAQAQLVRVDAVGADKRILDVGPATAAAFANIIAQAGTVVWNGPLGVFEIAQFAGGTQALAKAIAASEAFSIAGGGDTLAAIAQFGIGPQVDYISTGGGAFLEVLEGKTLPAFEVLAQRADA